MRAVAFILIALTSCITLNLAADAIQNPKDSQVAPMFQYIVVYNQCERDCSLGVMLALDCDEDECNCPLVCVDRAEILPSMDDVMLFINPTRSRLAFSEESGFSVVSRPARPLSNVRVYKIESEIPIYLDTKVETKMVEQKTETSRWELGKPGGAK